MHIILTINKYWKKVDKFLLSSMVGLMALILVANVLFRFVLQSSLSFAEEVGSMLMIFSTYLGAVYCVRGTKHIRMTMILEKLTVKNAKRYSIVVDAITGIAFTLIGYWTWKYMLTLVESGIITSALKLPRWIIILPISLGMLGTGIQYFLLSLMNVLDKETYWIGTDRKFGEDWIEEIDDEIEGGI